MSHLSERKTRLVFTTSDTIRERGKERAVVFEAKPTYAILRLAGLRKSHTVSFAGIYHWAAWLAAERRRAEAKARRKSAAAARGKVKRA